MNVQTFYQLWDVAVRTHAHRPFLLFRAQNGNVSEWSYAEFDQVVSRAAAALRAREVGVGDPVHLAVQNSPAFVALWLAIARIGAWMVPVDPASVSRDITQQVQRVHPKVGFCGEDRAATYRAGAGTDLAEIVELTETAADVEPGGALDGPGDSAAAGATRPDSRLAVMFTSGTTATPKGVVLTQANYRTAAETMAAAVDLAPRHRWYVTLPLFHANAQYYCFAPAIAAGSSVALAATFTASGWVPQARELGVTHASLFAAPIRMILARTAQPQQPLGLEHVWFAQNLGAEHYEQFAKLVGTRPRQLYGMTETVAIVCCDTRRPYRNDVIGTPVPGRRILVRDPITGSESATGEPGELAVWGVPGGDLFDGYLYDPPATARVCCAGDGGVWFSTGDLVTTDTDEVMRFVGRIDDVIKVSGENVSLTEIEAALSEAPGVLEAAVVAQPDPTRDTVPIAYVVPRDTDNPPQPGQLRAWAVEHLAPAARPRQWHVIGELPRTSVGKIRRSRIRATMESSRDQHR